MQLASTHSHQTAPPRRSILGAFSHSKSASASRTSRPPDSVVPQKRKSSAALSNGSSKSRKEEHGLRRESYPVYEDGADVPRQAAAYEGARDEDGIDCRCGSDVDDGFSICCDSCNRWAHCACFGIDPGSIPDTWLCWMCAPHLHTDKNRRRGSISSKRGKPLHDPLEDEKYAYVEIDSDVVVNRDTQNRLPPPPNDHTPYVFGTPPRASPTILHAVPPIRRGAAVVPPDYALHSAASAPPKTFLAKYPSTITPTSSYLREPANGYSHSGAPKRFVHLVGPPLDVALDARGRGGKARWARSGCWPNAELRAYVCTKPPARPQRKWRDNVKGKGRAVEDLLDHSDEEPEPKTHFGIFATKELTEGEEIVLGWEWDDANAVHRLGDVAGDNGRPPCPSPAQRHLLSQLANILHSLGNNDCACASSGTPHMTPSESDRRCVLKTMEDLLFPAPARATPAPGHDSEETEEEEIVGNGEEMEVDNDAETRRRISPLPSSSQPYASPSLPPPSTTSRDVLASKPPKKPRRLAGPGIPPPSPEAPDPRWGPLLGQERGVRSEERVYASGGWAGAVGVGKTEQGYRDGFGAAYAHSSAANETRPQPRKDYSVVERAGGWDVRVGGHDSEREDERDGDSEGASRSRDRSKLRLDAREKVVPPKSGRKHWPSDTKQWPSLVESQFPPRDKGKRRDSGGMDVDRENANAGAQSPLQSLDMPPPPRRPSSALSIGPSPSASFARLSIVSPHPGLGGSASVWLADNPAPANIDAMVLGQDPGMGRREGWRSVSPAPVSMPASDASLHEAADLLLLLAGTGKSTETATSEPKAVTEVAEPEPEPIAEDVSLPEEPAPPVEDEDDADPDADEELERAIVAAMEEAEEADSPMMNAMEEEDPYRSSPQSPEETEAMVVEEDEPVVVREEKMEQEVAPMPEVVAEVEPEVAVEPDVAPAPVSEPEPPVEVVPEPEPVREPTPPPPPPPVVKSSLREWQARKRQEREKEAREAEERERAKADEPEVEGAGAVAQSVDAAPSVSVVPSQGKADKENVTELIVVTEELKTEDGLARILSDIQRSSVAEKEQEVSVVVEQKPTSPTKTLSMPSFIPPVTEQLSPLIVMSALGHSRTPSPAASAHVAVKPASPTSPPRRTSISPPPYSPVRVASPLPVAPSPPPPLSSNAAKVPAAPFAFGPAQTPTELLSISLSAPAAQKSDAMQLDPPPTSAPVAPLYKLHARDREEGEISNPPSPTRPTAAASPQPAATGFSVPSIPLRMSPMPSGPPTQPRSYTQGMRGRPPPSAPKALREAQQGANSVLGMGMGMGRWLGQTPLSLPPGMGAGADGRRGRGGGAGGGNGGGWKQRGGGGGGGTHYRPRG